MQHRLRPNHVQIQHLSAACRSLPQALCIDYPRHHNPHPDDQRPQLTPDHTTPRTATIIIVSGIRPDRRHQLFDHAPSSLNIRQTASMPSVITVDMPVTRSRSSQTKPPFLPLPERFFFFLPSHINIAPSSAITVLSH